MQVNASYLILLLCKFNRIITGHFKEVYRFIFSAMEQPKSNDEVIKGDLNLKYPPQEKLLPGDTQNWLKQMMEIMIIIQQRKKEDQKTGKLWLNSPVW